MHFTYCPHCGEKLTEKEIGDEGMVPWCGRCRTPLFDIPDTCVIVLAVNECGEAALLRQNYVSRDHYVCVAGHIKPGATAESSAAREVEEEIGLPVERTIYIGSYAYGKKELLMLGFLARVKKAGLRLSCEVDGAAWFPLSEAAAKTRPGSIAMRLIEDCAAYLRAGDRAENFFK